MKFSLSDIDRLKNGDNEPLKKIFSAYAQYCINTCMKRVGVSKEAAEDVFVDAMLNLRLKIIEDKLKKPSNLKSYLISTCLNMSRTLLNERVRQQKRIEDDVLEMMYVSQSNEGSYEYSQELLTLCKETLNQLSDKCREILLAFYVSDLSMKEIAQEFELANSNVAKTTKNRCYKRWKMSITEALGSEQLNRRG